MSEIFSGMNQKTPNTPLAFVFDGNRNILPRGDAGRELSSFEAKITQF